MVATTTPKTPPKIYPINVAVEKDLTRSELPDGNSIQQLLAR